MRLIDVHLRDAFEEEAADAMRNALLSAIGAVLFALLTVPLFALLVYILVVEFTRMDLAFSTFLVFFTIGFLVVGYWQYRGFRHEQPRSPAVGERSPYERWALPGSWRFRCSGLVWIVALWSLLGGFPGLVFQCLANVGSVRFYCRDQHLLDFAFELLTSGKHGIDRERLGQAAEDDFDATRSALLLLTEAGLVRQRHLHGHWVFLHSMKWVEVSEGSGES